MGTYLTISPCTMWVYTAHSESSNPLFGCFAPPHLGVYPKDTLFLGNNFSSSTGVSSRLSPSDHLSWWCYLRSLKCLLARYTCVTRHTFSFSWCRPAFHTLIILPCNITLLFLNTSRTQSPDAKLQPFESNIPREIRFFLDPGTC